MGEECSMHVREAKRHVRFLFERMRGILLRAFENVIQAGVSKCGVAMWNGLHRLRMTVRRLL
jgi:hypothetical protein